MHSLARVVLAAQVIVLIAGCSSTSTPNVNNPEFLPVNPPSLQILDENVQATTYYWPAPGEVISLIPETAAAIWTPIQLRGDGPLTLGIPIPPELISVWGYREEPSETTEREFSFDCRDTTDCSKRLGDDGSVTVDIVIPKSASFVTIAAFFVGHPDDSLEGLHATASWTFKIERSE